MCRHGRVDTTLAEPLGGCAPKPHHNAGSDEQPGDLGFRDHGHRRQHQVDGPQQLVLADTLHGELVRAHGDDADYRGAHPIEDGLHPTEAAETHIAPAQRHDHQEGGYDERNPHQRRAEDPVVHIPQIHRQLCRQWTGHELGEGKSFLVIRLDDPPALIDEVTMHVPSQGYRTAEAEGAEP